MGEWPDVGVFFVWGDVGELQDVGVASCGCVAGCGCGYSAQQQHTVNNNVYNCSHLLLE